MDLTEHQKLVRSLERVGAQFNSQFLRFSRDRPVQSFTVPKLPLIDKIAANAPLLKTIRPPIVRREEIAGLIALACAPKFPDAGGTLKAFVESIDYGVSRLPERIKKPLIMLAHHGWFIDCDMPITLPRRLAEAMEADADYDLDGRMLIYFSEKLEKVETNILAQAPARQPILTAAFAAHRRGDYVLSVPVFLSQADGVCKDIIGCSLFKRSKKKPAVPTRFNPESSPLVKAFLSPLMENLPISFSEDERTSEFKGLNRHQVLHGESLDYGTELNSLKAISLLSYLVDFLPETAPKDPVP